MDKYSCECGSIITNTKYSIRRHKETKKHQKYLEKTKYNYKLQLIDYELDRDFDMTEVSNETRNTFSLDEVIELLDNHIIGYNCGYEMVCCGVKINYPRHFFEHLYSNKHIQYTKQTLLNNFYPYTNYMTKYLSFYKYTITKDNVLEIYTYTYNKYESNEKISNTYLIAKIKLKSFQEFVKIMFALDQKYDLERIKLYYTELYYYPPEISSKYIKRATKRVRELKDFHLNIDKYRKEYMKTCVGVLNHEVEKYYYAEPALIKSILRYMK